MRIWRATNSSISRFESETSKNVDSGLRVQRLHWTSCFPHSVHLWIFPGVRIPLWCADVNSGRWTVFAHLNRPVAHPGTFLLMKGSEKTQVHSADSSQHSHTLCSLPWVLQSGGKKKKDRNMVWRIIALVLMLAPSPLSPVFLINLFLISAALLSLGAPLPPLWPLTHSRLLLLPRLLRQLSSALTFLRLPCLPVSAPSHLLPDSCAHGCRLFRGSRAVGMKMPDEELIVSLLKLCLDHLH